MLVRKTTRIVTLPVSIVLTAISFYAYQATETADSAGGASDAALMDARQLQGLVAPIALYPDPLIAQILAAATFPDQLAIANYWLQQNRNLAGESLIQAVDRQSWSASVKALTQFPSVLDNMAKNLAWVSTLGEAYHDQASELMAAIQTLRAQAKARGNLRSGPQITVTQPSPQTIVIEPTNPQVVYVPQYNPADIYGTPYVTPGYSAGDALAGSLLGFGSGVGIGALASGGWNSWSPNWGGGTVVYNHNNFYGNPAWHGGYYNGAYHDGYGYRNAYDRSAYDRATADYKGYASRAQNFDRPAFRDLGDRPIAANSWAHADSAFRGLNAFNGFGDRFGGGGWQSRADSFRGWGSMRAGGFSGGRFGGGHFGGGGFHGFHGGGRR